MNALWNMWYAGQSRSQENDHTGSAVHGNAEAPTVNRILPTRTVPCNTDVLHCTT